DSGDNAETERVVRPRQQYRHR
ncbi:MAG: hypothetical protein QOK11_3796, partial [Pseudonocardiales bacterium]|nr:hypothetical protein [Pseudonocardiales bacterium]